MPAERPNQTLADYVALAISPALLMALVGSLVFFLLEIFYSESGAYKDRLQWILFFFVFGAVLVARMSITESASRAGLYGLVLAVLTWIGMQIYVEYPKDSPAASFSWLINLGLVGVVWWCSSRLTRDCTQIDEETEVGGEGLLQASGLERPSEGATKEKNIAETDSPTEEKHSPGWLIGWWERYQRFREGRNKHRVLGAWVIYFSLGALPLFGLGEALIPADETARRQYAFWLMALYVGSGLGLLLTTCFLSLRRYLRQRRLQMPTAMTFAWLTAGGGLIAALLVIGALLPRPRPEYTLIPYQGLGSEKLSASKYASQGGSSGKGEGNRKGDQPKGQGKSDSGEKDGKATGKDKGEPVKDKDKGGSSGEKDKDGAGKGQDKDKSSGEKDKGDDRSSKAQDKPPSKSNQPPQKDAPPAEKDKGASQQQKQTPPNSPPPSQKQSSWDWAAMLATIGTVLKWIVFAVIAVAVVFYLLTKGLKFLANFTDWAKNLLNALQNLWSSLFAGRVKEATDESGDDEQTERAAPMRSFASYGNPFRDGRGDRLPIKEVVRYTFTALQVWARERNMERQPEETPLEFAKRLGEEFPALEAEVLRFTTLYARAAYDYSPLPGNSLEAVKQLWKRLESGAEQPSVRSLS
jgi:Domain of unknown function (DUF4129)